MKHLRWLLLACCMVNCATTEAPFEEVDTELEEVDTELEEVNTELEEVDTELEEVDTELEEVDTELEEVDTELGGDEDYLEEAEATLAEAPMTYATANIGRKYGDDRAKMESVIDKIGNVVGSKNGPKFIGWQEIAEKDPCGEDCEIAAIRKRFKIEGGWETNRPRERMPDGKRVKVPITSKGANGKSSTRAVFASRGWKSPPRFITVTHYPSRNVTVLNIHFINGAWSCMDGAKRPDYKRRRGRWFQAWKALKAEVAKEHDDERNVVVTGDFNRPRVENHCNPPWVPRHLHERSRVVGGKGIDYIFAVPAKGQRFDPSKKGSIGLGIDKHKAHWVTGRFR